ncbi:MAG: DUF3987 domain-containing protein, partial [Gammaproteobacteria bacterium]
MSNNTPTFLELPPLTDIAAWPDPIPFDEIEIPNIPAHLLPGILGEYAAALANATETPDALSVMAILGVISLSTATHFVVSPIEGWHESINTYALVGLPPANNKSLVLRNCTSPVIDWEKEQLSILEPKIRAQKSKNATQKIIIDKLRAKVAKAKTPSEEQELMNSIVEKESQLSEPITPLQLFASDVTPESLATSAYEQKGRFALFSDEGGALEVLSGLYTNGNANIDTLLKGIDGGEIRLKRKDKSLSFNPYLTLLLAIQPAIIQRIGEKRAFSGNGILERF